MADNVGRGLRRNARSLVRNSKPKCCSGSKVGVTAIDKPRERALLDVIDSSLCIIIKQERQLNTIVRTI